MVSEWFLKKDRLAANQKSEKLLLEPQLKMPGILSTNLECILKKRKLDMLGQILGGEGQKSLVWDSRFMKQLVWGTLNPSNNMLKQFVLSKTPSSMESNTTKCIKLSALKIPAAR